MVKTLISVIIPIYNAEDTIERTVQSVACQQLDENENLEIILIDDGSNDTSALKCIALAEKYSSIKFYQKKNGGVSTARNYGLQKSRGDYLVFVDADDLLVFGILKKMLDAAISIDADLVIAGYEIEQNGQRLSGYIPDGRIICGSSQIRDAAEDMEITSDTLNGAPWAKLFKRKVIVENYILFPENICFGEDFCFCADYYQQCQKIFFLEECGYIYCRQKDSLVTTFGKDSPAMYEFLHKKKLEFFIKNKECIRMVNTRFIENMISGYERSLYNLEKREAKYSIWQISNNLYLQEVLLQGNYDIRSKYIALMVRMTKKKLSHLIYIVSRIKSGIKECVGWK